ncbi:MAG: hypothetical protein WCA46_03495 [Actinocatenispora sp.]
MTMPVLLAPMRAEARGLRLGSAGRVLVLHTGTGPVRARRAVTRLGHHRATVVGVGGGLRPELATGHVVVATELRTTDPLDPVVPLPAAAGLAATLRLTGLTVHTGPVVSVRRIVTGRARDALAGTGALLVDTESYWLLGGGPVRPVGCVRVVADTVPDPVLHPATLRRLRTALARLPGIGSVLADWVAEDWVADERVVARARHAIRRSSIVRGVKEVR